MSSDEFQPNAGSYQLLNDSTAPFSSRLKLYRALWVSKEYVVPRKYQLLLNWLCSRINSCVDIASDFRLCVETMTEFLNSKCLEEYLTIQATNLTVKPVVTQTISEYLTRHRDTDIIKCLKILTETLFTKDQILCVVSAQYEPQAIFTSSWINLSKSRHKIDDACSLDAVIFLLKRSSRSLRGPNALNKALLPFCKNLLIPMLELHYKCSTWKNNHLLLRKDLTKSIESYLASVLFTRENSKLYDELQTANFEQKNDKEESGRRNKKVQRSKRLAVIMSAVQKISAKNSSDKSCAGHCIQVFFRLFLTHSNCEKKIGIAMLQELSKLTCMHEQNCSDIINCTNLNLEMLKGLLQVTLEYRLYQPAVNHEQSKALSTWLKNIMENLVEKYSPNSNWISCAESLAEIDKMIVEPRLKTVLLKLTGKGMTSLTSQEINNLIHHIVDVYVRNRQSLRLVNIVMIVIEDFSPTEDTEAQTMKRIADLVEEFGCYIGKQFSTKLSPSLVIEIWSSILEKVTTEVEKFSKCLVVKEDIKPANVTRHQLLLKFFKKIVEKTPMFAIWDHMTVRKKLDKCLETLKSTVVILRHVAFSEHCLLLDQKCVENYLIACIVQVKIMHLLENYVEVKSESISPGFPTFFGNKSTFTSSPQSFVADVNPDNLTTNDSMLYFVELSLIRIKQLSNKCSVVEILGKTGRLSSKDGSDLHAVSKASLGTVIETLLSILQGVKPSRMDGDDAALRGTLFHEVLARMSSFSTIIFHLDVPKLHKWLINAIAFVIFKETRCSSDVQNAISEFFSAISDLSKASTTTFEVICCSSRKFSEVTSGLVHHLDMSKNAAEQITLLEKETIPDFSVDESKSVCTAMTNYIKILELCNLTNPSLEQSLSVFANVVSCIQIVEGLFQKFTVLEMNIELRNIKVLLKGLVKVLLKLTSDKGISLLKHSNPARLLMYFSRIKALVGDEIQNHLKALLQELILSCYHNSTENAFAMLKEGLARKPEKGCACTTNDLRLDTLTLHIETLINVLSFDDENAQISSEKFKAKSRKRKLRDEVQTCKKLKLENGSVSTLSALFDNLHQLYQEAVLLCKEENINMGKSYFDMLSASTKAYTLLKSNEDYDIVKIDGNLAAKLASALEDIQNERQIEVLVAKLQFVRSTLRVEVDYEYQKSHLQKLIQCFENVSSHSQATMELKRCIRHFILRIMMDNFQTDIFNEVVHKIRFGSDKTVESNLKFTLVLLDSNLLLESAQSEDTKVEKNICTRFIKSLLETLTIMITNLKDVDALQATTLSLMNETIAAIVKLKWIRLQTTEISSIFLSLRNISLERIYDTNGVEIFNKVFGSCCDLVHSILLNHKEIGRIAAICNAAFRQLLNAAMHLGVQKTNSATRLVESIHDDKTYNAAILCAGRLEKLFQLVADNYKKEFAKCMSYVVADYTCILTSTAIVPFVKKFFTNAIYHLVSMMDEYDTAMIRKALPPGVRDNFQELFLDFGRNFKYKGFV